MANFTRVSPRDTETRPHVNLYSDDSQLVGKPSDSPKPIAIIGSATTGEPNKVYEVKSLTQAKKIFGPSPLFDAIELAWQPNNNTFGGAGAIYATRIEDAKAASLVEGSLTFTSQIFGEDSNNIAVALSQNPLNNSYTVKVSNKSTGEDTVYDNLGRIGLVNYQPNDPKNGSANIAIKHDTDGTATSLTLNIKDTATPVVPSATTVNEAGKALIEKQVVFDLSNPKYGTLFNLLDSLNIIPNVTVEWASASASQNIPSTLLDAVDNLDITKPLTAPDAATLWAVAGDMVEHLCYDNNVNVVADVSKPLPSPFPLTNLAGGETGDAPISWANKFHNLDKTPFYYLVPLTDSSAIHAEAVAYVNDRYSAEHNSTVFAGAGVNETVSKLLGRVKNLNSPRAELVGTSGSFNFQDGRIVGVPAYMVAAAMAGIASSLPIGNSITYKEINLVSTDQNFTSNDLDNLNEAGVITVTPLVNRSAVSNYRITNDPTTAVANPSTDILGTRLSMVEARDFMFDDLRYYLASKYIGETVTALSASQLADAVDTFLYENSQGDGYILSYDPASINVTVTGNSAVIYFSVALRRTLESIDVYGTFTNYTETANGANSNASHAQNASGDILSGDDNSNEWTATSN